MLRNFKKNYSETIEEYTTRIMSFADGCRLDPETKKMYMHMAFMNGISYDPAMQRYIEKHTQEQPVVRIVDLMSAAQRYMHNKTGTSGAPKDKINRRVDANNYTAARTNRNNSYQSMSTEVASSTPQFGVLKTGRKEMLQHDDPSIMPQVEAEQEKVQQEKEERASNRAAASRRELEVMQEQIGQLKQLVQQQTNVIPNDYSGRGQGQQNQSQRYDNYRGGGRYNNGYRGNGYNGQSRGYRGNNYRGNSYPNRGGYNGGYHNQ